MASHSVLVVWVDTETGIAPPRTSIFFLRIEPHELDKFLGCHNIYVKHRQDDDMDWLVEIISKRGNKIFDSLANKTTMDNIETQYIIVCGV